MNHTPRDYRMTAAATLTTDTNWITNSLLVKDEPSAFTEQRLREHLAAVHARLVDRVGGLVERGAAPGRREERELRFLLDELIEALHRLDVLPEDRGMVS